MFTTHPSLSAVMAVNSTERSEAPLKSSRLFFPPDKPQLFSRGAVQPDRTIAPGDLAALLALLMRLPTNRVVILSTLYSRCIIRGRLVWAAGEVPGS